MTNYTGMGTRFMVIIKGHNLERLNYEYGADTVYYSASVITNTQHRFGEWVFGGTIGEVDSWEAPDQETAHKIANRYNAMNKKGIKVSLQAIVRSTIQNVANAR
jgi:hypothetical protein